MNTTYYKNQVIQLCSDYAAIAYMGQFRKDKVTPYITHPARVASMASPWSLGDMDFIIASAAWLHDVMEDCSEIIEDEYSYKISNHIKQNSNIHYFLTKNKLIEKKDGEAIFELVDALTMSQDKKISKKERKEKYYEKLSKIGYDAILIKYCDRIDNLLTVEHFSRGGMKWYIKDTEIMIEKLSIGIQRPLRMSFVLDQTLEKAKEKYKELYGDK